MLNYHIVIIRAKKGTVFFIGNTTLLYVVLALEKHSTLNRLVHHTRKKNKQTTWIKFGLLLLETNSYHVSLFATMGHNVRYVSL